MKVTPGSGAFGVDLILSRRGPKGVGDSRQDFLRIGSDRRAARVVLRGDGSDVAGFIGLTIRRADLGRRIEDLALPAPSQSSPPEGTAD